MYKAIVASLLLALLVVAAVPQATASADKQVLLVLLGDACSTAEKVRMAFPEYSVACMQGERFYKIAYATVDPRLFDYYYVVFVTLDRQEETCGLAYIEEGYAWACNFPGAISHEIKHIVEKAHCTSDKAHDKDMVYHRGEWVTCKAARGA